MQRNPHSPLAITFAVFTLSHLLAMLVAVWLLPPPALRVTLLRQASRRAPAEERFQATSAVLPSRSAWGRRSAPALAAPEIVVEVAVRNEALADSLPTRLEGTAGLPVAGPQMLARHLASGAFAMTDTRQMQQMERVLEEEGRRNVKRIELIPRDPLFHAFFDIDAHTFEGMGVGRLYGLEIDGRLAAIGGLSYRVERTPDYNPGGSIGRAALKPHLANLLYINALAYGLVQPSALGGRYLDKAEP